MKYMKMYQTKSWTDNIEEREVTRVTDKSVYYINYRGVETRSAKTGAYESWHNTKEEAIEHLRQRYLSKIENAENIIKQAKKNIEGLDNQKKQS